MAALEDYDWDASADRVEELMRQFYPGLLEQSFADASSVLPFNIDFNLSNPSVLDVIDRLATQVRSVPETTREDIRHWIEKGTQNGLSPAAVAEQIRSQAAGISKSRAMTIARTESATGYNLGHVVAYRGAGVTHVEVLDGDSDEECAAANGQTWTLEEAEAKPIAHPNCVRAFAPVITDDVQPPAESYSTTKEAEDAARALWPDTQFGFDGMHPSTASEVVSTLQRLHAQYPGVMGRLYFIGTESSKYGQSLRPGLFSDIARNGLATYEDRLGISSNKRGIFLNSSYFADPEKLQTALDDAVRSGWSTENSANVGAVVTHEFGHAFQEWLESSGNRQAVSDWFASHQATAELSKYALTAPIEAWAEAFTALQYGSTPIQYVEDLRTFIEGVMK